MLTEHYLAVAVTLAEWFIAVGLVMLVIGGRLRHTLGRREEERWRHVEEEDNPPGI